MIALAAVGLGKLIPASEAVLEVGSFDQGSKATILASGRSSLSHGSGHEIFDNIRNF